jgi:hypothetical protein
MQVINIISTVGVCNHTWFLIDCKRKRYELFLQCTAQAMVKEKKAKSQHTGKVQDFTKLSDISELHGNAHNMY